MGSVGCGSMVKGEKRGGKVEGGSWLVVKRVTGKGKKGRNRDKDKNIDGDGDEHVEEEKSC